ncbi:FG-GAP repeat domain-containing protein [Paraconexibacter algicola]|uniref:VCBS repeat-containing protein n=1 Tax=Paraconexibacter algicola TaxID=2133960 RepID=A0A2T4UL00_9ACTN|nr:VCBS repeat-containing protein [Paraconexibacter algicola]PTL59926.1 hypothetical protein C7Y72_09850 [Paraconexibacter algicola]
MRPTVPAVVLALAAVVPATAGAATPTFAPYVSTPTGSGLGPGPAPLATVAADLDADGRPDVVTAGDFGQGELIALRNRGGGDFGAPARVPGTTGAQAVTAGDVDGDGDDDVVAMTATQLVVLRAQDGTLTAGARLGVQLGAQLQVVLTDQDGDGDLDLAVPSFTTVQTFRNDGTGSFTAGPRVPVPGATSLSAVSPADLDGDAARDLLAADGGTGVVHALRGRPDSGYLVSGRVAAAGFGLEDVAAVDLDDDGRDDAAAIGSFSFTLATALGDGRGGFRSPLATLRPGGSGPTSAGVGDLDGDGREDLVVSTIATPAPVLRVHAGDGTVRPPLVASLPTGIAPQNPVIADFTGDGRPDIVVAGPDRIDLLRNTTP